MRRERLGELIANSVSHGLGVAFGVFALVILVLRADSPEAIAGVLVFSIALILLYGSSTLFHTFPQSMQRVFSVFQRFDHCAIYILIAGTYTPFVLLMAPTTRGYLLLGILWGIAILGIIFKAIWIRKFKVFHLFMYLAMGWSVVTIWPDIQGGISSSVMMFLVLGGFSYTIGIVFYISRFSYAHFVWHIFVLGGSVFHFISIYNLV